LSRLRSGPPRRVILVCMLLFIYFSLSLSLSLFTSHIWRLSCVVALQDILSKLYDIDQAWASAQELYTVQIKEHRKALEAIFCTLTPTTVGPLILLRVKLLPATLVCSARALCRCTHQEQERSRQERSHARKGHHEYNMHLSSSFHTRDESPTVLQPAGITKGQQKG
jgi:hypothetical protein